jgi:hypothetical protein
MPRDSSIMGSRETSAHFSARDANTSEIRTTQRDVTRRSFGTVRAQTSTGWSVYGLFRKPWPVSVKQQAHRSRDDQELY